jgi:hypothetical protein
LTKVMIVGLRSAEEVSVEAEIEAMGSREVLVLDLVVVEAELDATEVEDGNVVEMADEGNGMSVGSTFLAGAVSVVIFEGFA